MTELVSLVELLLGVLVVMGLGGYAIMVATRSHAIAPSLIVNRHVVLLHSDAEDDGLLVVLASYLRGQGCQIHKPVVPWLRFDAVNLFAELPPGIDCVIGLTVEAIPGQRIDVLRGVDTTSELAFDMLPIPVEWPTVEYTVAVRIRNLQGEFFRRTLHLFRWAVRPGNMAADVVGETIITALAGLALPTTEAGSREEVAVQ